MTSVAGGDPATLTAQQITGGWADGLEPIEHIHHQAENSARASRIIIEGNRNLEQD